VSALVPDYEAAWEFASAIHSGKPFGVVGIGVEVKKMPVGWFGSSDREMFLPWIASCNIDCNCYIYPAELNGPLSSKATRTDVRALPHLFVDIDPRDGQPLDEERARILESLRNPPSGVPIPSIIVSSGGGYQAYWTLREPIIIDGDLDKANEAGQYNRRLAQLLGGDHCHSVDHLMRLPWTINRPNAKKRAKGRVPSLAEVISC